jgi:protein-disulfide isomerase
MKKTLVIGISLLVLIPFLFAGCTDKKQMERIEQNQKDIMTGQKDILTRLGTIETAIKKIPSTAAVAPKRPTVDYNKIYNLPIGKSHIRGPKNAKVTVVEFSDFQCPYCARLQPTLKQVLKAYPNDVRLVYKNFPLSFHKNAKPAAKAALAAGEQGKYWEMHDLIFANFSKLSDDIYVKFAEQLKLDVKKFTADSTSNKYDKQILEDIALGRNSTVTGTPTLYMNGKRMQRRSFDDFKAAIDAILKGGK